jgi:single-stranded-DNA-specific exonuclease
MQQDKNIPGPLLGVENSAKGMCWHNRLKPEDQHTALAISQRLRLPEVIGRILASRGIGIEEADSYLQPSIKNLMPDPHSLQDMETGAERLVKSIQAKEKIIIFGDYDVDGATSSAMLSRFLTAHQVSSQIYIPDRMREGYGPNPEAVNRLADDGAELLITVDCGITSYQALAIAQARKLDVIVIDHHQSEAGLPPAYALINPNRQDDVSGQGQLAAAGVAFLFMVAVTRKLREAGFYNTKCPEPDLLQWLDLVALATVCDVVPLTGLNRAYVIKGLQVMSARHNTGLQALSDVAGIDTAPGSYHLGFMLGPRINAGGRIGASDLGAELLTTTDEKKAAAIASRLDVLNTERKEIESLMLEEAEGQVAKMLANAPDLPVIVTGSDGWHKGVAGLVASRITEKFARPSIAIAWEENGEGTGSARSIAGADIGDAVRAGVRLGLLLKGGGHAMAAGITIQREALKKFTDFIQERLAGSYLNARHNAELSVDGTITARAATSTDLIDTLDNAGPYGAGNPQPCFVFPAHVVSYAKIVGANHVRCTLKAGDGSTIQAIAFRSADTPLGKMLMENSGQPLHIAGHLRRNHWQGRINTELTITDVATARK